MEYKLVLENDGIELMKTVNGLIADGWKPLGGVSVTTEVRESAPKMFWNAHGYSSNLVLAQAMIRDFTG